MPRRNGSRRSRSRRVKFLGHRMHRRTRAERKLRAHFPKRRVPAATERQARDAAATEVAS